MGRRRLMSDALRADLARDLGIDQVVAREGWGAVSARECGRLVQQAILRAERTLAQQPSAAGPGMRSPGRPTTPAPPVHPPSTPTPGRVW